MSGKELVPFYLPCTLFFGHRTLLFGHTPHKENFPGPKQETQENLGLAVSEQKTSKNFLGKSGYKLLETMSILNLVVNPGFNILHYIADDGQT
jgi:hypothetical protein